MQKIIPFVLLLALMLPFGAKVALVANYWMYQKQYLEMCQNKDKPAMKCNGKCHLASQMAKVAEESNPEKPVLPDNVKYEITSFLVPEQTKFPSLFNYIDSQFNYKINLIFSESHLLIVYHPPC